MGATESTQSTRSLTCCGSRGITAETAPSPHVTNPSFFPSETIPDTPPRTHNLVIFRCFSFSSTALFLGFNRYFFILFSGHCTIADLFQRGSETMGMSHFSSGDPFGKAGCWEISATRAPASPIDAPWPSRFLNFTRQ